MDLCVPTMDFTGGANSLGSNSGVNRATKKVETRLEFQLNKDDPTVDGNGKKIMGSGVSKVSYKVTLLGDLRVRSKIRSWMRILIWMKGM